MTMRGRKPANHARELLARRRLVDDAGVGQREVLADRRRRAPSPRASRFRGAELGRSARAHLALREIENADAVAGCAPPWRACRRRSARRRRDARRWRAGRPVCESVAAMARKYRPGDDQSPSTGRPTRLLVPQRDDRIEPRRADRGQHPEHHAGDRARGERRDDRRQRRRRGNRRPRGAHDAATCRRRGRVRAPRRSR